MNEYRIYSGIGEWLREQREARRYSLRELGERAGVKFTTIASIENGGGVREGTLLEIVRGLAKDDSEVESLLAEAKSAKAGAPVLSPAIHHAASVLASLHHEDQDLILEIANKLILARAEKSRQSRQGEDSPEE